MKALSSRAMLVVCLATTTLVATGTTTRAQNIGAIQAEQRRILAQVYQCKAAMDAHFKRMQIIAPQGRIENPPACSNNNAAWVTRLWQLDIAIARANGDRRHPCQIEYMAGCENYRN
jgi:hypothetical protein